MGSPVLHPVCWHKEQCVPNAGSIVPSSAGVGQRQREGMKGEERSRERGGNGGMGGKIGPGYRIRIGKAIMDCSLSPILGLTCQHGTAWIWIIYLIAVIGLNPWQVINSPLPWGDLPVRSSTSQAGFAASAWGKLYWAAWVVGKAIHNHSRLLCPSKEVKSKITFQCDRSNSWDPRALFTAKGRISRKEAIFGSCSKSDRGLGAS